MINNIAYFPLQTARNSQPVMSALLDCLHAQGIKAQADSWDSDAVIIWSMLWSGRMTNNQKVYQHYRALNRPVIVVDVGALYRNLTWKIAVGSITAKGYYGHTENLDLDRPRKLGISLAINVSRSPRIVIAAQHAGSQQVANLSSMEDWIQAQVHSIRQVTDRPMVIRPHPRSPLGMLQNLPPDVIMETPVKIQNSYDSYNLAFDCHALVNYNSGPGIQAALAGTRPIVDPSSLAHPVSVDLANLELPYTVDRDQWLIEICHTEYTIEEIRSGLWLQRLAPAL